MDTQIGGVALLAAASLGARSVLPVAVVIVMAHDGHHRHPHPHQHDHK